MSQKDKTEQEAMAIAVNGVHAEFIHVCCISQFLTVHMHFYNLLGRDWVAKWFPKASVMVLIKLSYYRQMDTMSKIKNGCRHNLHNYMSGINNPTLNYLLLKKE